MTVKGEELLSRVPGLHGCVSRVLLTIRFYCSQIFSKWGNRPAAVIVLMMHDKKNSNLIEMSNTVGEQSVTSTENLSSLAQITQSRPEPPAKDVSDWLLTHAIYITRGWEQRGSK